MSRIDRRGLKRCAYAVVATPVGRLTLAATDRGLAAILWENDRPDRVPLILDAAEPAHPVLVEAARQLEEYFAGTRTGFALPLDAAGTGFQQRVWSALQTIPFGETRSYGEIARQIGSPAAARAVGAASARNPLSIVAPCHRVVGAAGALTGFAGGVAIKGRLLALERAGARPALVG
jgi:methylated-DNA-[protein]-cysteine S-methyltransferase